MSLERFWRNISNAKRELDAIESMRLHLRPGERTSVLQLDLWLTPQTIEGYDPDDYWFLPPEEQDRLRRSVEQFAEQVRPLVHSPKLLSGPVIQRAESELRTVLDVLQPGSYRDAQDYRVDKVLRYCLTKLQATGHPVDRIVHQVEEDSTGEDALWIWVIVEDSLARQPTFFESTERIRSDLERMLRAFGVELWPFIHFRTVSEQAGEDGGAP